jgi:hypothetical protein
MAKGTMLLTSVAYITDCKWNRIVRNRDLNYTSQNIWEDDLPKEAAEIKKEHKRRRTKKTQGFVTCVTGCIICDGPSRDNPSRWQSRFALVFDEI